MKTVLTCGHRVDSMTVVGRAAVCTSCGLSRFVAPPKPSKTHAKKLAQGIRDDMANVKRGLTNSRYRPADHAFAMTAIRQAKQDLAALEAEVSMILLADRKGNR